MKRYLVMLATMLMLFMVSHGLVSAQTPEREVAELTNQERIERDVRPLIFSEELSRVAEEKARDMYRNKYFSHDSPTYGSPFDMMRQYGISFRAAGENIAMGQRTAAAVVQDWMNSTGHRRNILNSQFDQIGVGHYQGYWVQMFILSANKVGTPAPVPPQQVYDPSPKRPDWPYYTVQPGDTAWKIAMKHWITLQQLQVLNPAIRNLAMIYPGQKIRVSGAQYIVKPGDTAWKIARKHGMTLAELRVLNPQDERLDYLYVGQGLYVR